MPRPVRPVLPESVSPPSGSQPEAGGTEDGGQPGRPNEGARATEPVDMHFEQVELGNIIKAIGAQTGRRFLFDPQIGTIPVTLISHEPMPPELLLPALQAILVTHGFSMRETLDGNLIKIRPIAEDAEKAELITGRGEPGDEYEEFSTHIVPIRYASAEDMATLLPRLGSKEAKVDAYGPTNTLIITDNAHGIRNMLEFIEEVDMPGSEMVMEIFSLEYARAEVLATQIQDVLIGADGTTVEPGRPRAPRPVRPTVRPTVPGQAQQTIVESEESELRIVPDERLNMLVVMATEASMRSVRELINKLDTPTPYEANNMHVYELQNADAEELQGKLTSILSGGGGQSSQGGGNSQATTEVQALEKEVSIEWYEPTNSLLVVASPQDYRVIKELIAQLDVPQRQVHVEAIIMEVSIQDRFQLAVETASLSAEDGFAINNVVSLANILSGGPLATAGSADSPVLTTGVLDGTVDIPISDGSGGLTMQTIPKVPLLLTALDSVTDLNVLSQPLLTTVDNKEATITIGQEVPITTGTSSSLDQSAVGSSIYSQIERRDVGIIMNVTPQISEGDNVYLELEVEVSQPIQSDVGADPNLVGPTFSISNVTTPVVVRDGCTGVVGGLISETTDRSTRQTPYVGDLPVLGWLFRRKSDLRSKRNLVVLVTPHIIKEGTDSTRITDHRLEEFNRANMDAIFEKGFIKKLKMRHYMRTKYHPSDKKMEQLEEERFNRGTFD